MISSSVKRVVKIKKEEETVSDDLVSRCLVLSDPEMFIHSGDMVYHGGESYQWPLFADSIAAIYSWDPDMKFNKFRAEIEHVEITHIPEKMDVSHKEIVWRQRMNSEDIIRHEWQSWILKIDKELPALVRDKFIVSGLKTEGDYW